MRPMRGRRMLSWPTTFAQRSKSARCSSTAADAEVKPRAATRKGAKRMIDYMLIYLCAGSHASANLWAAKGWTDYAERPEHEKSGRYGAKVRGKGVLTIPPKIRGAPIGLLYKASPYSPL